MNEFDQLPAQFLPNPPQNIRTEGCASGVVVSWEKPVNDATNSPEAYLVYRSGNGYGFGNPVRVSGEKTSVEIRSLPAKRPAYFRVTALNPAGESLPSAVAGALPPSKPHPPKILFVNGFTDFNRFNNARQTIERTNYVPPSAFGKMERTVPRLNNAFDYVVQHGNALGENGTAFDSCQREAVARGLVALKNYSAVVWAAGREMTNILDANEQRALSEYLASGGKMFISGSHLTDSEPASFLPLATGVLTNSSVACFAVGPRRDSIFRGNPPLSFGQGDAQSYFLATANVLHPSGENAREVLRFADGSGAAGVQCENSATGAKIVCFGFPFETISSPKRATEYLSDILRFFEDNRRTTSRAEPIISVRGF
jgi:hypothetical protein